MKKAALFDLDGVVFDTESQYTEFWGSVFRHYYPDQPGLEHKIKGSTLVQIYDLYFADRPADQTHITDQLNDFERHMRYNYVPGFETFVRDLRKQGVKTAVVTSSNVEKMLNVYRSHPDFPQLFDAVLTSEDFSKSKPDPDGYLKGAARLGLSAADCVGFEDSVNGLKALNAARMFTVGLDTTNTRRVVEQYADLGVSDFTDPQLWQRILLS